MSNCRGGSEIQGNRTEHTRPLRQRMAIDEKLRVPPGNRPGIGRTMFNQQNTDSGASIFNSYVVFNVFVLVGFYSDCFLASKVELFTSNDDTNTFADGEAMDWDYLGYITLSDNQSTGFKSRELKSANVPTSVASFVKLKLSRNHVNSYNINNQVCGVDY